MKRKILYICDVCGDEYVNQSDAERCERKPATHDRGVEAGDRVLITHGDYSGEYAIVTDVKVSGSVDTPRRYHHTIFLDTKVENSPYSRILYYDWYDVIAPDGGVKKACTCNAYQLENYGCLCGAKEAE